MTDPLKQAAPEGWSVDYTNKSLDTPSGNPETSITPNKPNGSDRSDNCAEESERVGHLSNETKSPLVIEKAPDMAAGTGESGGPEQSQAGLEHGAREQKDSEEEVNETPKANFAELLRQVVEKLLGAPPPPSIAAGPFKARTKTSSVAAGPSTAKTMTVGPSTATTTSSPTAADAGPLMAKMMTAGSLLAKTITSSRAAGPSTARTTTSSAPAGPSSTSRTTTKATKARPAFTEVPSDPSQHFGTAAQAMERFKHDPLHAANEYEVGYEDPSVPNSVIWKRLDQWPEHTDEENFIPENRIRQIRFFAHGCDEAWIVWYRGPRVDETDRTDQESKL